MDKVIPFIGGANNMEANALVHGMISSDGTSGGSSNFFQSSARCDKTKECEQCIKYHEGKPVTVEGVILTCLDCFLGGGKLYLFAYSVSKSFFYAKIRGGKCSLAPSDPSDEVLHRAQYLLDHGFGTYNLLRHNCEDFALYCKTGFVSTLGMAISGQAICFGASQMSSQTPNLIANINAYFDIRYKNDLAVREDVYKMPVEEFVRKYAGGEGGTSEKDQAFEGKKGPILEHDAA